MPFGWTGRVLKVDLSAATTDILRPEDTVYRRFIGGKGLAGYFLRPQAALAWDHPDMPLLVFAGPLVGTSAPTSGRVCVMSRSPLTGTLIDSSVGGRLGTQLKKAGWDGIVITGRSPRPCGIEIRDDDVRIVDGAAHWGQGTDVVFDTLCDGRRSVATVGPAAENGVNFAALMVDRHHAAGRGGIGRCFAAKRVKYLTVAGSGHVAVYDPASLKTAREQILRLTAASPVLMGPLGFARYGTAALYDLMDARRMMPTENFKQTHFDPARRLNAHALRRAYRPADHGCTGCHVRCKKIANGGPWDGASLPEFETLSHFTALIGNTDMDRVMDANRLCNRYGMDTISAAATLACHGELGGRTDLGDNLLGLLAQIGTGATPLGRALGRGALAYARDRGDADAAMSVKGLELPAYDPRGAYGMSLAFALSTRGGCHLRAYPVSHEILRKPVATNRFSFSGKARIIKIAEDQNAVVDSLTACKFIFFAAGLEEYARAYTAVTGVPATAQDLLQTGARIDYQERLINAANGFTAADDDLPPRFFTEAGSSGNAIAVRPLDRCGFIEARARYYRIRGLDPNGRPRPHVAAALELT